VVRKIIKEQIYKDLLTDYFASGKKGKFHKSFIIIGSSKVKHTEDILPARSKINHQPSAMSKRNNN
jgi:hypothetical protein